MTTLDYSDRQDFEDADRGFIGTLDDPVIKAADGRVVWDCAKYNFIAGDAPATANPSLWRQGKLVAKHGLYELVPGAYQVRGLDLSNMSLIETDGGVIVIDPLMGNETAAAALALYRKHRGDRPVKAYLPGRLARFQCLVAVSRRSHSAVRCGDGCCFRLPPLADLGHRADRRFPLHVAGHLCLHA